MQNNELRVSISIEESEKVENLFNRYNAYIAILEYLSRVGSLNEENKFFDKKWDEAVKLYIQLEAEKTNIDSKYRPNDDFKNYHFDFINHQLVYTK